MSYYEVGQHLRLPTNVNCYGYGVDPLPNDEVDVIIDSINELNKGISIMAKAASGYHIRFVVNTSDDRIYANTIDNVEILNTID